VLNISLFETEDDLRQGDATLNAMDPPIPGALGQRTSVEMYEVGVKLDCARGVERLTAEDARARSTSSVL